MVPCLKSLECWVRSKQAARLRVPEHEEVYVKVFSEGAKLESYKKEDTKTPDRRSPATEVNLPQASFSRAWSHCLGFRRGAPAGYRLTVHKVANARIQAQGLDL